MRRFAVPVSVLAVALAGLVVLGRAGPGTGAQDDTPDAAAGHPLVGAWAVRADANQVGPPGLVVFTDEGVVLDTSTTGANGIGSWAPTGPRTAEATWVYVGATQEGRHAGSTVFRVAIAVDGAGDTFAAEVSRTDATADGAAREAFRGTGSGVRIPVEGLDAAGLPLEAVLLPATPAATPAATPEGDGTPES